MKVIFYLICGGAFMATTQARPDLLPDLINDCERAVVTGDTCAILYDDDGCEGWELPVKQGYTELTWWYRNDAEAVLVKRGCTLVAYDKKGKSERERGRQFILDAASYRRHLFKDLRGSNELEDDIESVECQCVSVKPNHNQEMSDGPHGASSNAIVSSNAGGDCLTVRFNAGAAAVLFDDKDCQITDWDAPLYIKDGEYRTFSMFQSIYNWDYKNTLESFALRQGCTMELYRDSDFSDGGQKFHAIGGTLIFSLGRDPKTSSLNNDVESIRVYC